MKKLYIVITILIATGCAVNVKTYQKPDQSFDDYVSWCWLKGCEVTYQGPSHLYNQKAIDEISNAIAYNMYQKGYEQKDDSSDLVVNFFMILKEDSTEMVDNYDGFIPEIGWMDRMYPEYQRFLKGSLIIDVIDRKKSEVVWRSTAVRYMELTPIYDQAEIRAAIAKAMKKLPARDTPR